MEFKVVSEKEFDVLVVGGGTTGVAAAIAAARNGARTAIVEYHSFLGGNAVNIPVWLGFHDMDGNRVIGGIPYEITEKLQKEGAATPIYRDPITSSFAGMNPHLVKVMCSIETVRAGVEIILHSMMVAVETEEKNGATNVTGVYVMNREGLHLYTTSVVIDCTDTGEVALKSGVKMQRGREKDNKVQVSSWTVTIGNVNFDALLEYYASDPTEIRPFTLKDPEALLNQMRSAEAFVMGSFRKLIKKAKSDGMNLPRDVVPAVAYPKQGEIMHVASRVENVDPNDNTNYSKSELTGMEQIKQWLEFFRRYVPGCENCRLISSPSHIGIRETNHMEGEYLLTGEDLIKGRQFDDVIGLGGYHIDIHSPDHQEMETEQLKQYQMPYRCLVPKTVDGILVAGRAISATHEAYASTRVIPISMVQGQAAGTAAALAVKTTTKPRNISVPELQTMLKADGVIF